MRITEPQVDDAIACLGLMDLSTTDGRDAATLLRTAPSASKAQLQACREVARFRGTWLEWTADLELEEAHAVLALLLAVPATVELLEQRGVDAEIIAATMADFGRHLRRHRRYVGRFGLLHWRWFLGHVAGNLYEIGRLQYKIHQSHAAIDGLQGRWVAGIHIPADSGPLTPESVDESLGRATTILARLRPELDIRSAPCNPWPLVPWLTAHLRGSNIAACANRFTSFAPPADD